IRINIIHQGVGAVTESDVMLAKADNAIIINFNGTIESGAESMGQQEGVEIRTYNIIYKLIDDVKLAMEGMLEPEYEEVLVGKAEVRNLFKFSKVGTIAGCFVTEGKLTRGFKMHILRDKKEIYNGKLESLKRFKEDVKIVEQNFECGIAIVGYDNFKVGDIIEVFETREKARKK
ncbi:MAG: EF-Tu/IF-2/RF-3 family GTPase, partial [Candidatus Margulisiibacteriota bacterium]